MQIIIHRINTLRELEKIPHRYGVEIDVRGYGDTLLLSHDSINPDNTYDTLEKYLKAYQHAFIVFNIKEAGYESRVIELAQKYNISNYFLLDVEFPYLYRATRKEGVRKIAVRYSEAEPIQSVEAQLLEGKPLLDWVWIDTNTQLPLTEETISKLRPFKTCLVCPDRWGRSEDIEPYITKMKALSFEPDAVMTALSCASRWENGYTA